MFSSVPDEMDVKESPYPHICFPRGVKPSHSETHRKQDQTPDDRKLGKERQ